MPQSRWLVEEQYGSTYDDYLKEVRIALGDTPFLDLGRFLPEDKYFDLIHPNLEGAELVSRRIAKFIRDTDAARPVAKEEL